MFIRPKQTIVGLLLIFHFNRCTRVFKTDAESIIMLVNTVPNSTWKAGLNFRPGVLMNVSRLTGVQPWHKLKASDILPMYEPPVNAVPLPSSYDVTKEWSECESVVSIRDQSNCGSCWALSTASAFGDCLCIASNAAINEALSGEYVNSCCVGKCGDGCDGGHPEKAWKFIKNNGLCTGGEYASQEGCQPYSIAPCQEEYAMAENVRTPACSKDQCTNAVYISKIYSVKPKMEIIMNEVLTNGPVVSAMKVYEDFINYKSGIYRYNAGKFKGDHAIKLIGWSQDDGIDYWLCSNTWGPDWGTRGMFKIRKGTNECGIESRVTGGLPILYQHGIRND